ncbi:UDP-N-acetylmuramate--L-alanine ligase [Patescibacteria group bacterium]|nr:UDP-N-acetylmuramate--L-alanine ligase [Patescibacteria group bacterium]MBU1673720.1 UDP-N-acetylmuramate--L-alanine ligase [Patescibacteria group bacterium]MBU1963050.1 UDP-N-acetylmuramate--L-alanine ligase [Patescibacteria group bacterium]
MKIDDIKKVYIIGIGGIGISGLARIFNDMGKQVVGSDMVQSEITDEVKKEGIQVIIGQDGSKIDESYDLIVFSDAVPKDNPERLKVGELGLDDKEFSYFDAAAELMKEYEYAIAVSGTHGKTTTCAMIAEIMIKAGLDPTVIVGSKIKKLNSNARLGKDKKYFIIEACEHKEHMMRLSPKAIVMTNIEEDHLDYYRDLEHIEMTFQNFINKLPKDGGLLVKNNDDSESRNLGFDGRIISYGIEEKADVMAKAIKIKDQVQEFKVGKEKFKLKVPGKFNVYNALSAIAMARELGIDDEIIHDALFEFEGTWRRFEYVCEYKGAQVISDYAHHPTAVSGLINAAKDFFPKKRIFIVFQPHQHNRTKKLYKKFIESFDGADFVILQEIFDVPGREEDEDQNISSKEMAKEVEKRGKYVFYSPDFKKTKQLLDEHLEKDNVLLIVGAGDIYLLVEELCSKK